MHGRILAIGILCLALAFPALAEPNLENLIEQGSHKLLAGDDDGALALFAQAAKLNAKDPRPHYLRGAALAHKGDRAAALLAFRAALALNPQLAEVHNESGVALEELGRQSEALAEFAKATELKRDLSEAWANWGRLLLKLKQPAEAARVLSQGAQALTQDVDLRIDLSLAWRAAGKLDDAVTAAREAAKLQPRSVETQLNLGLILQAAGKLDEAAGALTQATVLDPTRAGAWWSLGEVERDRGHLAAATTALEKAEGLRPSAPISASLAGTWRLRGDSKRAAEILAQAMRRSPASLALQLEHVRVLAAAQRCPEAQAELAKLAPQKPTTLQLAQEINASCPAKGVARAKSTVGDFVVNQATGTILMRTAGAPDLRAPSADVGRVAAERMARKRAVERLREKLPELPQVKIDGRNDACLPALRRAVERATVRDIVWGSDGSVKLILEVRLADIGSATP